VWRRVVPLIAEAVALRPADSDALRAYCEAAALRARALRELDAPGVELVLITPNGAQQINPLITIADKAAAVMMKHAERFGLDPASRKRLQIAQKKGASAFAEFLESQAEEVRAGV
jgi:P27 family predicted phage terminase small subunit